MESVDVNKKRPEVLSSSSHKCCLSCWITILGFMVLIYVGLYYTWNYHPKILRKILASQTRTFRRNDSVATPVIQGPVFILILINSIPKTASRRKVLRETWAGTSNSRTPAKSSNTKNEIDSNLQVFCVFLVAISDNEKENTDVVTEAFIHGDILQIRTQESYRNMIHKIWGGFKWAQKIKPKYLMKVDDDIYVDLPHLITWLHEKNLPDKLYTGWVLHHGRIMRSPGNQWYVSHAEFYEHFFPDYCIGPFYVFSGNLLGKLIKQTSKIKMFSVEDAYLGILMRSLQIAPMHSNDLFVWEPRLVSMLPKWEDEKYSKVICLGERLDSKMIRFIHLKYQKLHQI